MPASRHRSRSPDIACAVIATIGMCGRCRARCRESRAVASRPFISGICTSISTTSKVRPFSRSSACRPLSATVTRCPRRESISSARRWFTGLSSASRMSIGRAVWSRPIRSSSPPPDPAAGPGCRAAPAAARRVPREGTAATPRTCCRPGAARHLERAAHLPHQRGHDGQAQAGAAVAPGGRSVGLRERLEDQRVLVFGDADAGVGDRERDAAGAQRIAGCRHRRAQRSTRSRPACVNLIALPTRFVSTWPMRSASPITTRRQFGRDRRRRSSRPLRRAMHRERLEHGVERGARSSNGDRRRARAVRTRSSRSRACR